MASVVCNLAGLRAQAQAEASFPWELGWEIPLGKAKAPIPAPASAPRIVSGPCSNKPRACESVSKALRIFRLGQWSRLIRGALYSCTGFDLNKGQTKGVNGVKNPSLGLGRCLPV